MNRNTPVVSSVVSASHVPNVKDIDFDRNRAGTEPLNVVHARWMTLESVIECFGDDQVSLMSLFKHNIWDFRLEGLTYRIDFNALVGTSGITCFPLIILLKIIAYSMLREQAIIDRAPRTIYNILYAAKPLIKYLVGKRCLVSKQYKGYFLLPGNLTADDFYDYLVEVNGSRLHQNTKLDRIRFLSEWWKVSGGEKQLPSFLRLTSDPFGGKKLSDFEDFGIERELVPDPEDEAAGWQAIPLEYAFPLATSAIDYIETYSHSLARYYEVVNEGIVREKASSIVTRGSIMKACAAHGITFEELVEGLPFELKIVKYAPPSDPTKFTYRFDRAEAERCLSFAKRAAVTIILFTTGMRNRELRGLEVGCCVPDPSMGVEGFYRLTVVVKKTSKEYYQGQVITIPVPRITYLAVKALERLGTLTRRERILVSPLQSNEKSDHVSSQLTSTSICNYIKSFARDAGIDYEPHPHQFRKTIAGWFVLNSPVLGPLLVMRLFSHTSISMTEMYLRNNPFIIEARQEMLVEQSLSVVKSISQSAQVGKLAGTTGERLKASLQTDPLFKGLTGDELGATLEEYLAERAQHGSMHFLLTPMAICVFDPTDESDKPCANTIPVTDVTWADAGGLPIVNRCVGASCDHCLLTQCQAPAIEQSLSFYRELIEGAIKEDYAQNLHIMASAKEFVQSYTPVAEALA